MVDDVVAFQPELFGDRADKVKLHARGPQRGDRCEELRHPLAPFVPADEQEAAFVRRHRPVGDDPGAVDGVGDLDETFGRHTAAALDDRADLPREGENDIGGAVEGDDLSAEDELFEPGPEIGRLLKHLIAVLVDADGGKIGGPPAPGGPEGDPGQPLGVYKIGPNLLLPVAVEKNLRIGAAVVAIVAGVAAGLWRHDDEAFDPRAGLGRKVVEGLGPGPQFRSVGGVEEGDLDAGLGEVKRKHPRMPLDPAEPVGIDTVGKEGDVKGRG